MSVDVLICNFTRLGDLLQTQPLINDLKEAGYTAGIVCQQNFASALPLLRNVRQSWALPGAKFLSGLDKGWPLALGDVLEFARQVREEARPKYILNLTPTLSARLFTRLLAKDAAIMGFGIDDYGYGLNEGVWSSFISVAARQRINAPFNVADMLRRLARPLAGNGKGDFLLAAPDASALEWADDFISKMPETPAGFVALQPGASSACRRWPIESFRKLGRVLWEERKIAPILLGSTGESDLGLEYGKNAGHPWLNAIGKTSFAQAAALLKKCRLLVSNDTGTMHLAAGQDVAILAFFLATAQPWDTAPLRPDSCCLEPRVSCHPCSFNASCQSRECANAISPESAAQLVTGWLDTGNWAAGVTDKVNAECRVWLTGRGPDNLSTLACLNKDALDERDSWLPQLRNFWGHFLDSIDSKEPVALDFDGNLPVPEKIAREAAPVLLQAGDILESIRACGKIMAKNPQAGKLFLKNSARLQALLDSCPPLSTLAAFWKEFSANQGNDLKSFIPAIEKLGERVKIFASRLSPSPASMGQG